MMRTFDGICRSTSGLAADQGRRCSVRLKRPYAKGYRAEKRVRRWFEKQGYFVMESRGSRGPFDGVAWQSRAEPIAYQVKGGKLTQPIINHFWDLAPSHVPRVWLIHWPDRAPDPIIYLRGDSLCVDDHSR